MLLRHDLAPELRVFASEVFNRSWQFIERDPVLVGEDRQGLQEQLAQLILQLMSNGERNLVVLANNAIRALRDQYAMRRDREIEEAV